MDSIRRIDVDKFQRKRDPKPKFRKRTQDKKWKGAPEFDLHWKTGYGMSNYDILTLQSETLEKTHRFAILNRIIVFIHGVGEGV
jgi:hypothetical protein